MIHHLCSYSDVRSTQMELQAGESLVILSYTKRIRKNEEKRYSRSMIKMADNIQAMLRFCVEEAEAGLCAQENGILRIAIQAAVHHSSSDAIFAAYSALALVFAARWKMPLAETRRWRCV